jgi:hypothetical protein
MKASDILPDDASSTDFAGVSVRKGTVAAFLQNAKTWTESSSEAERANLERDIVESIPALRALGLFDVLIVRNPQLRALIDSN